MSLSAKFETLGAALANASRAQMLCVLMDGRAFTNKELAHAGGVTPQTATAHLQHLADAGLTVSMRSGRSVYHRLASPEVAEILERMGSLTPSPYLLRAARNPGNARLLAARSCYNHLAGRLGVRLMDVLVDRRILAVEGETARLLEPGFLATIGMAVPTDGSGRRPIAKPCLDWTERRPHLGGPLATSIMTHALAQDWIRRGAPRVLTVTERGYEALAAHFNLTREEIDCVPSA
ncbi:MAG: transcriptional regulator [Thalassobaculaceae bacterium]|nr:transcriptional regulator [Thalassobaculaceae bacterium]